MRDVPELTFRGALSVLGHYDRPVLDRLNTLLGGVIMVGGAVALTGPVAAPAVALAALWGWVDQKNEAVGLVRKLLDRVGEHRAAARGFDRTRLIAAAHTILVVGSAVDAFRRAVGDKVFKDLEITDKELARLLAKESDQRLAEIMYDSAVPKPSVGRGYTETLADIKEWQDRFVLALRRFSQGFVTGKAVSGIDSRTVAEYALRRYEYQYRRFAAQLPEFLVWNMLNEFGATRALVANAHEDVRRALGDQVQAMSRLESLLSVVSGAVPDQVTALHRAARAGLDEQVVTRDAADMSPFADIRFPLVREIFVQPHHRVGRMQPRSRVADEHWWRELPRRGDLDLRLATHLTSAEATRLPLLVLGHPGAGKSMLMKVLAARLPSDQYTTVYAPLRHMSSTASVYDQVEQALRTETNGRVDWASLVHQSRDTTMVILLDGLDEMLQATDRDRAGYLHDVAEFQWREATLGRPVVVLVTSRTLVADRVDVPSGTTVIKLEEFDAEQIEQWRKVWNAVNRTAIEAGKVRELTEEAVERQNELARQPLLLLMLAVYSADPSFPAIESSLSRTALYRTLFETFTRREATKLRDAVPSQDQLERLSVAALGMFNRGRQHITDVELASDLAALTTDDSTTDPEQRLVAQFFFVHTAEANLGTDRARRSYEFLHATFGEYLVARETVDTLVDTADSMIGRRGAKEPDDDRLFALLSHDCLAVRGPVLDFIGDLLAELPDDRERITQTVVTLLAGARHRQGSTRYADYRPTGADHVRAIAAYTANLVLLAVLVDEGIEVPRATLDLWRAGLATDSWYALLAALERDHDLLRLSNERTHSTGVEAELRHAELTADDDLKYTLRMGYFIRESAAAAFADAYPMTAQANSAEYEELLGWLVTILAFGIDAAEWPNDDQLSYLLNRIIEPGDLLPMINMVLKQRSDNLPLEIVRQLVAYLLAHDNRDVYAFIAAASVYPRLLSEFPQLTEADRYKGMQGAELMLQGGIATRPTGRLERLLESITHVPPSVGAAALLAAFQWRVAP